MRDQSIKAFRIKNDNQLEIDDVNLWDTSIFLVFKVMKIIKLL